MVDHGWHTDIGIPAGRIAGPLARFRSVFAGARALVFSFGKRTFMTAKVDRWEEYLLGPFPGPGAILVTGLAVLPDQAYPGADAVALPVPAGGMAALSRFLWRQFARDSVGEPKLIARGPSTGSLFYAASVPYGFDHTCNAWTAEALQAAGIAIRPAGVVFSGQVMGRARRAASCPFAPVPG